MLIRFQAIRAAQAVARANKEASLQKYKVVESKANQALDTFVTTINPFAKNATIAQRLISWLVIVYGYFAIMRLYYGFRFINFPLPDKADWAIYYVIVSNIFSALFLPVTILFFALRKRLGWFLLWYELVTSILNTCGFIISLSNLLPKMGIPIVESKAVAIAKALLWIVFYALSLYCLYRNDVRGLFRISKKAAVSIPVIIIVLQVLLSGLAWVLSYYYNY